VLNRLVVIGAVQVGEGADRRRRAGAHSQRVDAPSSCRRPAVGCRGGTDRRKVTLELPMSHPRSGRWNAKGWPLSPPTPHRSLSPSPWPGRPQQRDTGVAGRRQSARVAAPTALRQRRWRGRRSRPATGRPARCVTRAAACYRRESGSAQRRVLLSSRGARGACAQRGGAHAAAAARRRRRRTTKKKGEKVLKGAHSGRKNRGSGWEA
jgi:hypothetical protein